MVVREEIIKIFIEVGRVFRLLGAGAEYSSKDCAITATEFEDLDGLMHSVEGANPWFSEANVRKALQGLASWLTEDGLNSWTSTYPFASRPKEVAIIMAGNIPLVGFHDFLCVLLSGHIAKCKLSSQDKILWLAVFKLIETIDPRLAEHYSHTSGMVKPFDAVIATGSNNTARVFESYVENYPNIIRKNRTSVAVLNGTETNKELDLLADDIFAYYGFGCRNVSQIFVPQDFDIQRIFSAFAKYGAYINHHKYMNNFDYYRALYMLNNEDMLENGFVLLRFNKELHAPPAVLNCYRYQTRDEVQKFITEKRDEIQAVVGHDAIPFGAAQCPALNDYADGVDTMAFLAGV